VAVGEDRSVFELTPPPAAEAISYGDHPDQFIEFFPASSASAKKLGIIHGGYWRPEYDLAYLRPYADRCAEEGFDTYLIEYRRTPGSPDHYIEDIRAAVEIIGECALIGHSAGGHLAVLASEFPLVTSVVALAPVTDLVRGAELNLDEGAVQLFLGEEPSNRPDLNPIMMESLQAKITVIHGVNDIRVPVDFAQQFAKKFPDVEYIEIAEIGHFEVIDPRVDSIFQLVLRGAGRARTDDDGIMSSGL